MFGGKLYYFVCREMYYSQNMSLWFAFMGILGVLVVNKTKYWPEGRVIAFYTAMDILQAVEYNFVGECDLWMNKFLTVVAHIFVCVQPSLWNLYRFWTNNKNTEIFRAFFWSGVVFAVFYSVRLLVGLYDPSAILPLHEMNVAPKMCTEQGPSHIRWMLPYASFNGLEPNYFTYLLIWVFPALYEDTNHILKFLFWNIQIQIICHITENKSEVNSVWSLLSVPLYICYFLSLLFAKYKQN
ncbi:MAG: hypothetical protein Hyperionvirus7_9 [Hyperionvirus sp.]|uniref:Uncharacterized protein n=1 Tax=Hyperionvirus sp. TaxID=2487770 RepID=A0A3G5A8A8_9VIRU|nr:MAG: hypothetical protein Hyperionvirus7_9 [Hyperionvirus sp.]